MHVRLVLATVWISLALSADASDGARRECSWEEAHQPPYSGEAAAEQRIIDLSLGISADSLSWGSTEGLGPDFRTLRGQRSKGDVANMSWLRMDAHTATHLDAPSHFVQEAFDSGKGVESLSLATLNGPALLVDVPATSNITADVMRELAIPRGTRRVLFRTANTAKRLMHQRAFDYSYQAFTADGAQWLVDNTDIALIGIDYLSIAHHNDLAGPHDIILGAGIIPVEGLLLEEVPPGLHQLHCLPLKVVGSDGAPVRCIITVS